MYANRSRRKSNKGREEEEEERESREREREIGGGAGRRGSSSSGSRNRRKESAVTRAVNSIFRFVRLAEFEILFVLFFLIAFLIFKDLTSRPEYNQILVKKPGGGFWPY